MIDDGLVEYRPNTEKPKTGSAFNPGEEPDIKYPIEPYEIGQVPVEQSKRFYYQLCTAYQHERKNRYAYGQSEGFSSAESMSKGMSVSDYDYNYYGVPRVGSHPAGKVCYDLYADGRVMR